MRASSKAAPPRRSDAAVASARPPPPRETIATPSSRRRLPRNDSVQRGRRATSASPATCSAPRASSGARGAADSARTQWRRPSGATSRGPLRNGRRRPRACGRCSGTARVRRVSASGRRRCRPRPSRRARSRRQAGVPRRAFVRRSRRRRRRRRRRGRSSASFWAALLGCHGARAARRVRRAAHWQSMRRWNDRYAYVEAFSEISLRQPRRGLSRPPGGWRLPTRNAASPLAPYDKFGRPDHTPTRWGP